MTLFAKIALATLLVILIVIAGAALVSLYRPAAAPIGGAHRTPSPLPTLLPSPAAEVNPFEAEAVNPFTDEEYVNPFAEETPATTDAYANPFTEL